MQTEICFITGFILIAVVLVAAIIDKKNAEIEVYKNILKAKYGSKEEADIKQEESVRQKDESRN